MIFIGYLLIKGRTLFKKQNLVLITIAISCISLIIVLKGPKGVGSDLSRLVIKALPKSPSDVYQVLFNEPVDSCVKIVNIKDQVPHVNCCIWMEVKTCPKELNRIIASKAYQINLFDQKDAGLNLNSFNEKPDWWTPQTLGNTIIECKYIQNQDHSQTLFFTKDSTRVFICDKAL